MTKKMFLKLFLGLLCSSHAPLFGTTGAGQLDPSFNPNSRFSQSQPGTVVTPVNNYSFGQAVSFRTSNSTRNPGRRVIVVGSSGTNGTFLKTASEFNPTVTSYFDNGALNTVFVAPKVTTAPLPSDVIYSPQAGVIVLNRLAIKNSNGATADSILGTGSDIATSSDRAIVVSGTAHFPLFNGVPAHNEMFVMRLVRDRAQRAYVLDPNFNPNGSGIFSPTHGVGLIQFNGSAGDVANDVVVNPTDGSITLVGTTTSTTLPFAQMAAVRLLVDGTLDTGFDGGKVIITTSSFTTANAAVLDSQHRLVLAGTIVTPTPFFAVARLNAGGTTDFVQTVAGTSGGDATGVDVNSTDDMFVSGFVVTNPSTFTTSAAIAKLSHVDGSLDTTFGANQTTPGVVIGNIPDNKGGIPGLDSSIATDVVVQKSDDKPVICGWAYKAQPGILLSVPPTVPTAQVVWPNHSLIALVRNNADGTLDSSFGDPATTVTSINGTSSVANGIDLDPACNRIAIAAAAGATNTTATLAAARYLDTPLLTLTTPTGLIENCTPTIEGTVSKCLISSVPTVNVVVSSQFGQIVANCSNAPVDQQTGQFLCAVTNCLSAGNYTAIASTTINGQTFTSDPITFTVDTGAFEVRETLPVPGSTISTSPSVIEGIVLQSNGTPFAPGTVSVTAQIDGLIPPLGPVTVTSTDGTFSIPVPFTLAPGTHNKHLAARIIGSSLPPATADDFFIIGTTPPIPPCTSPADNLTLALRQKYPRFLAA